MKVLEFRDVKGEDRLRLFFSGALEAPSALERELEPFVQALEKYAGDWLPTVVEGKRRRGYSRAAIWKSLEETRDRYGSTVGFYRSAPPAVELTLDLGLSHTPPRLRSWLDVQPLSFFTEAERCRAFVELVRAWASQYPVSHALAHSMADLELTGYPHFGRDEATARRDGFDKIYEVFWLNVFGPRLVESVGRERMLSTPAHRVEELPNGAILLVTWPTAADLGGEDACRSRARALVHLRPDLDVDTVLRAMRERGDRLAPVEPHFPLDVAPLLSRVVEDSAISERQRKIAELNVYQPPEPDEWLPAGSAFPPDVEDPDRVRDEYGELAERLVALLHNRVPSVFKETPESLTDVDFQLWRENFPEVFERYKIDEHAVPAVGAYLGEVLVRNLGGRWIPRRKWEEAQVLVGQRVWFPFVRAQRYLGSRQALLDYSLTQLYQVAGRYRS